MTTSVEPRRSGRCRRPRLPSPVTLRPPHRPGDLPRRRSAAGGRRRVHRRAPYGRAPDPGGAAGADQGAQPRGPAPERRAARRGGPAGDAVGGGRKFAPSAPRPARVRRAGGSAASTRTTRSASRCSARAQRDDERLVRDLIDAVADAMPRQPPEAAVARTEAAAERAGRAVVRGAAPGPAGQAPAGRPDRPAAAGAALDPGRGRRGGAGRGRRTTGAAGARRAEPAAPLRPGHAVDPRRRRARLRERARTHATIALRAAADAWPVLDRLLELRVPDQLVLDTDELVSLLDEGVGALRDRGVDVLWPRSLGRDLSATATLDRASPAAPREEPLNEPLLGTERCSRSSGRWRCTATR